MWCPNCQNEYRAGITICPDCKVDLIEELEKEDAYTEIMKIVDPVLKDKIVKYLEHLNIEVKTKEYKPSKEEIEEMMGAMAENNEQTSLLHNPEVVVYTISVLKEDRKNAQKEISTILRVESEKQMEEHPEVLEELSKMPAPEPVKEFVKAKDRSADYKSSGWTFIIIGILFTAFIILNMTGYMSYFGNNLFVKIVFIVLGIACIVVGVLSIINGKKIAKTIGDENAKEDSMIDFLERTITKTYLSQFTSGSEEPDELQWMQMIDMVKETLITHFPDTNDDYADQLAEDFLNKLYQ